MCALPLHTGWIVVMVPKDVYANLASFHIRSEEYIAKVWAQIHSDGVKKTWILRTGFC